MSNIVNEKIDSLIKLAELENEPSVQIVLWALSGSITAGLDGLFAKRVQDILKDELMPMMRQMQEASKAIKN